MRVRSLLGSLQLPVAALGALCLVGSVYGIVTTDVPAGEAGFVGGLAVLVLYVLAWLGFCVLALGLAIPPSGGYGITFRRGQRLLFVLAAVAGVTAAFGPFLAFGLVYSNPELLVGSWVFATGMALCSLLGGLGWRLVGMLQARGDSSGTPEGS